MNTIGHAPTPSHQGHLELPLHIEGEQQAAVLADILQALRRMRFHQRCARGARQTTPAIAALHAPQELIEPGLRERCSGACEGLSYSAVCRHPSKTSAAWRPVALTRVSCKLRPWRVPGLSFRNMGDTIASIPSEGKCRKGVLVSHGGVPEERTWRGNSIHPRGHPAVGFYQLSPHCTATFKTVMERMNLYHWI